MVRLNLGLTTICLKSIFILLQGNQSQPFLRIRLNCGLSDLAWNPENPTMLVCVMEDGSVSIFEAGDNLSIKATIPAQAKATCGKNNTVLLFVSFFFVQTKL